VAVTAVPQTLSSARWRRIIPIAFITYTFAYLDRSNYSLGAAGGLTKDLHITAGIAGLLGALFFLGYFLFQIPAAHYAENRSVKRLMFWSLLGWGIFASAQGVIPWVWLLMVDRFLLGVVEAAVIPAMLVFLAHWFTSRERGRANTFLILGNPVTVLWMSAVSGYLIQLTSWRWMFIVEGLPAIVGRSSSGPSSATCHGRRGGSPNRSGQPSRPPSSRSSDRCRPHLATGPRCASRTS